MRLISIVQRKRYEDDAKKPPSYLDEIMKHVARNKEVTDELIQLLTEKNQRLKAELDEQKEETERQYEEKRELERQLEEMRLLSEKERQFGEEFRRSMDKRFEQLEALQNLVEKRMSIVGAATNTVPMLEQNNS